MSGRTFSLCLSLMVLGLLPAFITGVYRCTITRDPHLVSFGGQKASVAIPCAYLVTKLQLVNSFQTPGEPFYPLIEVQVVAGNSQRTINGRFYVSDLEVKLTFNGTTEGPTNTYYTGENLISLNTPWYIQTNDTMQGRVELTYDPAAKMATLTMTNTTLKIQFRPVDRLQGNRQTPAPGLFIEMGQEDFIPDPSVVFPQTLCSTVTDRTSLTDHAVEHGLTHRFMGLYAVLAHMQYNIPTGDQDGECPTFMGKFRICEEKFQKQAFEECLGLLHTPSIIKCFDGGFTNVTATLACGTCLDYHCSASLAACSRLSEYQGTCPTVGAIVDLSECANFNP